eukprot:356685-Rhodomonas_salina.1
MVVVAAPDREAGAHCEEEEEEEKRKLRTQIARQAAAVLQQQQQQGGGGGGEAELAQSSRSTHTHGACSPESRRCRLADRGVRMGGAGGWEVSERRGRSSTRGRNAAREGGQRAEKRRDSEGPLQRGAEGSAGHGSAGRRRAEVQSERGCERTTAHGTRPAHVQSESGGGCAVSLGVSGCLCVSLRGCMRQPAGQSQAHAARSSPHAGSALLPHSLSLTLGAASGCRGQRAAGATLGARGSAVRGVRQGQARGGGRVCLGWGGGGSSGMYIQPARGAEPINPRARNNASLHGNAVYLNSLVFHSFLNAGKQASTQPPRQHKRPVEVSLGRNERARAPLTHPRPAAAAGRAVVCDW